MRCLVVMTLLVSGCTSPSPHDRPTSDTHSRQDAAAKAPPAPPAAKPAIGSFGLDLAAGESSVKPGDDFFAYANGKWYDTFEIPSDRSSFGAFVELDELSKQRVREIVEQAAAGTQPAGSAQQKIGDYYASFMDESGIEAQGLTPAREALRRISSAASRQDIATVFGLPGYASLFDIDLPPDLKNPDRYSVVISQSALGLPDRDYYLKDDPKLAQVRAAYVAYIEQMLTLGGVPDARARARKVMAFETAASKAQWPIEKRRDVDATYNPRTRSELEAYAPGFPWQAFLAASELPDRKDLILSELTAIAGLAKLYHRTALPVLRDFLTFHYLSDHSGYLPKRFDEAHFAFYGRILRGQPAQRERWKRGVDAVDAALGEQVGQVYVARYFPAESKAKVRELVGNLRQALSERIEALEWMSPQTKARAHEKLASFTAKIGYPDRWKDYSSLQVERGDLLGNVLRAAQWHWRYQVARLDEPVDRDEWQMTPQRVNAYYNPLNNEIVFPAAILQPPFFDPRADDAVNYGGIGAVIGHEIGHGFDDQGRKFGPTGRLEDWWTPQDAQAFTTRVARLIKQYSQFEALPGLKVNGANTIGENIGDLGGLNMAYHAYHLSLHGQAAPVINGLTGDQRFFLSWAQVWRTKYREGQLRELVMSDVHSPAYFRVNGPLSNIDAWYAAFDVQPGDKLYIRPEERVSIW